MDILEPAVCSVASCTQIGNHDESAIFHPEINDVDSSAIMILHGPLVHFTMEVFIGNSFRCHDHLVEAKVLLK